MSAQPLRRTKLVEKTFYSCNISIENKHKSNNIG